MIFVTSFEPAGKGKCRVAFDNGIKCLLYRGEAARFSLKQEGSISEEQMNVILHDIVYKRAVKRTMHLLEQMDRSEKKLREKTGCWGISAVCYRLCNRLCEKISLHRRSEAGTKLCPLS